MEDTQGPQPKVEVDLALTPADMDPTQGVDQLHAVADGDVSDQPARAGQKQRDPSRRDGGLPSGADRPDSTSCTSRANLSGSRTSAMTGARCLWVRVSIQAKSGQMTSPQASISSPEVRSTRSYDGDGPLWRKNSWEIRPVRAWDVLGAAGLPPQLPGIPGGLDSQRRSLVAPRRRPVRVQLAAGKNGWRRQPPQPLVRRLRCRRPPCLCGAGREPFPPYVVPCSGLFDCCIRGLQLSAGRVLRGGGHEDRPNSTSKASGLSLGAGDGGTGSVCRSACRAWWASTSAMTSSWRGAR